MREDSPTILKVESIITGYGQKQVVNGVSLDVSAGEVVAIIGHNGAGKSTLLKAIFGLLRIWSGRVTLDGSVIHAPNPRQLLRAGVCFVPQGSCVFPNLTVGENLEIAGLMLTDKELLNARIERASALFPALATRRRQMAATLSGGEKQMLAFASALILSPRLLLLDEPSLGLAPVLVADALSLVRQVSRDSGVACLIVEQKVREVLKIADRAYVLRNGQVSFTGTGQELGDDSRLREVYL